MANNFVQEIAPIVQKYAPQYGILCNSAIIAQAILESGYGASRLSRQYHNYFGLKCGTNWKGRSVNMETEEEYHPPIKTAIRDNFRVYGSMEEGVKGYFDFIQLKRYQNLKGVKHPRTYLELISADGYATDSSYVKKCMDIIERDNLRQYDNAGVTAQAAIDVMRGWLGLSEHDGSHMAIVDLYNSHRPLAMGYHLTYNDSWCDATVSAAFIKLGAVDLIGGTECSVERHIQLFKAIGIWIEDGTITPQPGDIITYNWDDNTQPNDGWADHIGMVEAVNGRQITVIEGNCDHAVRRRILPVGAGNIRGYARPRYGSAQAVPVQPVAEQTTTISKEPKFVGRVTADVLNVRTWPGIENPNIKNYPILKRGNLVDVCDTVHGWYYVRIAGKWFGFVAAEYIERT